MVGWMSILWMMWTVTAHADPCGEFDMDGDGVSDECDLCPGYDDRYDADGDGVPDGCDRCAGLDDRLDLDGDGRPDGCFPALDVEGACPGWVAVDVYGVMGPTAVLVLAPGRGEAPVPGGPCAGADTGLSELTFHREVPVGPDGRVFFERELGPETCGWALAVVDSLTCDVAGRVLP